MFKHFSKNHEMNLCEGTLWKKIIVYSLPLILTNILQLLFNAADVAVLGIFAENGDDAVGAVGSTGALINLIIGLFVGLSVGANVVVARCVGKNDKEGAARTVGTSVFVSVIVGSVLAVIGYFGARTFLQWMNSDEDVIDMATKYMQIYFLGMPIVMLYNFCASILRAVGDTMRPLMYLLISGVANIGLNILFILVFKKTVEGVAIATVVSQGISAVLAVIALVRSDGFCKLHPKHLRIYKQQLKYIARIGLPAGLQGCVFSISNVLIQSGINSFDNVAITANAYGSQIDGFIYQAMYGVALSALAVVSQNYGAGDMQRVKRAILQSVLIVSLLGAAIGGAVVLFGRQICGIFTQNDAILDLVQLRLSLIASTYFLCGIMDTLSNSLRGLGKSTVAMIISLSGVCAFRILWLNTVFMQYHTLEMLYLVYPVSWLLTTLIFTAVVPLVYRATKKRLENKRTAAQKTVTQNT